jgi:hypothetical protein
VDEPTFWSVIEVFIEDGSECYVVAVLAELGVDYVDDIPEAHRAYVCARTVALWEESQ